MIDLFFKVILGLGIAVISFIAFIWACITMYALKNLKDFHEYERKIYNKK